MGEMEKIKPSCLEINVSGKLVGIEQIKGRERNFYANTIVIPAEDTFQKPKRIIVNSQMPFADEDQIINIIAHVVPQWRNNDGTWYFNCNLWKDKPGQKRI